MKDFIHCWECDTVYFYRRNFRGNFYRAHMTSFHIKVGVCICLCTCALFSLIILSLTKPKASVHHLFVWQLKCRFKKWWYSTVQVADICKHPSLFSHLSTQIISFPVPSLINMHLFPHQHRQVERQIYNAKDWWSDKLWPWENWFLIHVWGNKLCQFPVILESIILF